MHFVPTHVRTYDHPHPPHIGDNMSGDTCAPRRPAAAEDKTHGHNNLPAHAPQATTTASTQQTSAILRVIFGATMLSHTWRGVAKDESFPITGGEASTTATSDCPRVLEPHSTL